MAHTSDAQIGASLLDKKCLRGARNTRIQISTRTTNHQGCETGPQTDRTQSFKLGAKSTSDAEKGNVAAFPTAVLAPTNMRPLKECPAGVTS